MDWLNGIWSELFTQWQTGMQAAADLVRQEMPLYYARSFLRAVLVFIPGFVAAEAVRVFGRPVLEALRIERLGELLGLTGLLRKWRADLTLTAAAAAAAFWLTLLAAVAFALQQLAIGWLADLGRWFFVFGGSLLAAVLVQAAAWLAGRALAGLIRAAVEHPGALLAAGLVQALVLSLGLLKALGLLGLEAELARVFVVTTFAAASLAVALGWAFNRPDRFETVIRVADAEEER